LFEWRHARAASTFIPLVATLLALWLVRVPFAYLFVHWLGRDAMFFSYGAGWLVGLLAILPYYLSGRWKKQPWRELGPGLLRAEQTDLQLPSQAPPLARSLGPPAQH